MITGTIKSQVDKVWDAFWSGGISNPLEVIEQITYLLFLRRLDDLQINAENRALRLRTPVEHRAYPEGTDERGRSYEDLRWSHFKNFAPAEMYKVVDQHVFPFLRTLGGNGSTYAHHMKDARFTIPTPALLAKVVDLIADVPMEDRDTKGDLYEYMLSKIASAGQNGQFRTPRHIIQLMVEITAPRPCGTAGFLIAAGEHLRQHHPEIFRDEKQKAHFHHDTFHGFDFDNTMLRISSMNMLLHGVENPDIRYRDSLAQDHASDEERYSLVLANPPFAGSLDYENTAKDLLQIVKTKKTELLFLALFVRLLKPGGRAAVIVPDGVLFGSSTAHKTLRKLLVEEQRLDAVISLPSGTFKPYAGVSTAILLFTKTNSGGTDNVWFYDVQADGWSLDDKRTPLLSEDKLGPVPATTLSDKEHAKNNLPDVLARWGVRAGNELNRARTEQSFCVPKADIVAYGYDLSLNRYKEVVHKDIEHRPPLDILADLAKLERHDWEAANGQIRSFIEALFNDVARIRLGISATGGDARRKLQASGLLEERAAKVILSYTDLAGFRGSHAGTSSIDEANGNLMLGLGVAFLGLALLPELVKVEEVLALSPTKHAGGSPLSDKDIETSCPTCRRTQRLTEARIQRRGEDTVYHCTNGCQPIVVVGIPGDSAWPGRGYRMGEHVLRNAFDLYLILQNGNRVLIPASPAALMPQRPGP